MSRRSSFAFVLFFACSLLAIPRGSSSASAGNMPLSEASMHLRGGSLRHPDPSNQRGMRLGLPNFSPPFSPPVQTDRSGLATPLGKDSVERTIEIDATPDEVFRVASGFEDYPKWAGVKDIKVLGKGSHGLGSLVSMQVGMFGHNLKYTLQYEHERPRSMRWHAVSGSIKALIGSYEFTPIGPGKTRVTYRLNVDPGFYVPSAVKLATSRMVAGCALKELKKYTELPSTKLMLQMGNGRNPFGNGYVARSVPVGHVDLPRVWMLSTLL